MAYEITGRIIHIFDEQTFASGFKKREVVILKPDPKDAKWDQPIKLEFTKDNCDKLDKFRVGDEAVCGFDLRGNEHNGKFYVSLNAFKLVHSGATGEYKHGSDRNSRSPERERPEVEHERNRATYRGKNAYVPPAEKDDGSYPDF